VLQKRRYISRSVLKENHYAAFVYLRESGIVDGLDLNNTLKRIGSTKMVDIVVIERLKR
jgi:hypothetical protein